MAIAKWNVLFFTAIAAIIIWLIMLTSNQKMAKYNNQESVEGPDHSKFYTLHSFKSFIEITSHHHRQKMSWSKVSIL